MTLFFHYLKLAFRNIIKYKAQNAICILSIAVSATLLTVVGSFIGDWNQVSAIHSQPHAARSYRVLPIYHRGADQAEMKAKQERLRNADLNCVEKFYNLNYSNIANIWGENISGKKKKTLTEYQPVDSDFPRWFGVRSSVTGKVVQPLKPGECIISEQEAMSLLGTKNPIGKELEIKDNYRNSEIKTFRIVDVYRPVLVDKGYYDNLLACTYEGMERYGSSWMFVELKDGFSKADFLKEIETLEIGEKDFLLEPLDVLGENEVSALIFCNVILAFLILFLAVSVVGYLRMQTQLFFIRQREIALRTVLGGKRCQLIAQFFVEVSLVLLIACALSAFFNSLLRNYLQTNMFALFQETYAPMDDFLQLSLVIYVAIAAVAAVTIWLVVRKIRSQQTGLAMQMKPQRGSGLKVASLSFQMILSALFIAISVTFVFVLEGRKKMMNIPENDAFYQDCIAFDIQGEIPQGKNVELVEAIRRSPNVERVYSFSTGMAEVLKDTADVEIAFNGHISTPMVTFQRETEILDFYQLQVEVTNPAANPEKCAYIPRVAQKMMERGGTWPDGLIRSYSIDYPVRGVFDVLPYEQRIGAFTVIISDPDRVSDYAGNYVAVAKHDCYKKALSDIRAAYDEYLPEYMGDPRNYKERETPMLSVLQSVRTIFFILVAISLISTIAGLYSIISLDTRRRRKEVALRKVHGARTSVIAKLFARRYVVILSVCALLLLPLCIAIPTLCNGIFAVEVPGLLVFLISVFSLALIVFLTVVWKIREVMHLKPAEWLKE